MCQRTKPNKAFIKFTLKTWFTVNLKKETKHSDKSIVNKTLKTF